MALMVSYDNDHITLKLTPLEMAASDLWAHEQGYTRSEAAERIWAMGMHAFTSDTDEEML